MSRTLRFAAVASLACLSLAAQTAPPLSPTAQGYAEFELGKWAELQAESKGGGDYVQQALQHYTAAMAANPNSAYIATQMADLLSRIGRTDDAVALARSVVKDHPASVEAHRMLGNIYLRELNQARQPTTGEVMAAAVTEYQTLTQLEPGSAGDRVILGKLYGVQGQPAQAEQEFRAALLIEPTNVDALASLIQSLADQGHLDQAQQEVNALPPAARSGQVYATLGDAYLHRQRYADAASAFRSAVQAQPDDPNLQSALAHALMEGGDYPAALTEYLRLRQQTPEDGHAALHVAQLQMQLGQFEDASASLKTAAGLLAPDDIEVAYAGALLEESEGDDPAALTALRALVQRKTNPSTQNIFLEQLGRLQMRTGDYAGALSSFQQMEALGGSYRPRAQALEVELYTQQHNYPQALTILHAALQEEPHSRSLQMTYANLLSASGHTADALAALQPLLQGDASDWDVYLAQGQIELAARQWPEATAAAQHADQLAATPAQQAEAVSQLGAIQAKQQDFTAAEASFHRALDLDPGSPAALNALGYLLAQQGVRLPEALSYVQRALERDANNGSYLDSLGWIYFKMGQWPQAVSNLERAANLQRHNPGILDHLAQAYDRNGQLQQAASSWQQALRELQLDPGAGPESEQANEIQKELDAVRTRIAQAGGGR